MRNWLNSLTAKYVAVFTLLVAVPAIGISWYLLDSSYTDNKAALIRELQAEAEALAGRIDQTVIVLADRLGTLQGDGLSASQLDELLHALALGDLSPLAAFYIDGGGSIVGTAGAAQGTDSERDLARLSPDEFEVAKQGRYIGPTKLTKDIPDLTSPIFTIAVPENFGGGVMGMVLTGDAFQAILRDADLSRGYVYAVAPSGQTLYYPDSVYTTP